MRAGGSTRADARTDDPSEQEPGRTREAAAGDGGSSGRGYDVDPGTVYGGRGETVTDDDAAGTAAPIAGDQREWNPSTVGPDDEEE